MLQLPHNWFAMKQWEVRLHTWNIVSSCTRSIIYHVGRDAMENEEFSVIVRCWLDLQTNATRLRVVSVETGEEVHLDDASFLLRTSIHGKVSRCYIRHIASGNEAYVQGSAKLRAFVKAYLLKEGSSQSE